MFKRWTLALLLAAGTTGEASAQTLWQNVAIGMTPDQVQKVQPTAIANPKPDTLSGGATCVVHIPALEVAGSAYNVCFFFKNGGLIQVTLSDQSGPTKSQFDGVVTLLRAKYGKEVSLSQDSLGWGADFLGQDGVNVSVLYMSKYGSLLNINYQVRLMNESGKL